MSKPITTRINHSSSLGMKVREPLLDVGSVAKQQADLEDVNEAEENRIIIASGTPDTTEVIDPETVQGDLIEKEPSTNRVDKGSAEEAFYIKNKKRCDKLTNEQKLDPKNKCTGFAQKRKPDTKKCKEGYTMNAEGKCERKVKGNQVKKALQTYDRGTALSNFDMRQDIRSGKFQNRLSKQSGRKGASDLFKTLKTGSKGTDGENYSMDIGEGKNKKTYTYNAADNKIEFTDSGGNKLSLTKGQFRKYQKSKEGFAGQSNISNIIDNQQTNQQKISEQSVKDGEEFIRGIRDMNYADIENDETVVNKKIDIYQKIKNIEAGQDANVTSGSPDDSPANKLKSPYKKYMKSSFKLSAKSPITKALVGNQHKLPQHLQDAIKAAPGKSYKKY